LTGFAPFVFDSRRLRNYCICMHDVAEDNRPFDITELESTYPRFTSSA